MNTTTERSFRWPWKREGTEQRVFQNRTIHVNDPEHEEHLEQEFVDNSIKTSKYTVANFIFKNLFEQFRRVANFYFLAIACIQASPISPLPAYTAFGPLVFVIGVSAIKEAIEDYRRHQSDTEVNCRKVSVYDSKEKKWAERMWLELQVGDIVKLHFEENVPSDIMLLRTSSDPDNDECYLDASNLDGETHLRLRTALKDTRSIEEKDYASLRAMIICELPNNNINNFDGKIVFSNGESQPVEMKQMLLRGCVLKDTEWATGIVVFTGHSTKLMMNQTDPPSKRSRLEVQLNWPLVQIFAIQFVLCLVSAIGHGVWWDTIGKSSWYMRAPFLNTAGEATLSFFTFLILFSVLVPISLYVSMELVKTVQAYIINNDMNMYHDETDTPAKARTSNLNEDLGQITHIFSDKTGTLTQNKMEFMRCSVGSREFGQPDPGWNEEVDGKVEKYVRARKPGFDGSPLVKILEKDGPEKKRVEGLITLMAVCHTVRCQVDDDDPTDITYNAASPDEGALVSAAADIGYKLKHVDQTSMTLEVEGEEVKYEILSIIEFQNHRKRMSILVRCPDGVARLYTKGADEAILGRGDFKSLLQPGQEKEVDSVDHSLENFGVEGLRTLVCGFREVPDAEVEVWLEKRKEALSQIGEEKDRLLDETADEIEQNLTLIGATAIEDKLQDGVPKAITTLKNALIKVWVLTGDKLETAINIGISCGLVHPVMSRSIIINHRERQDTVNELNRALVDYRDKLNDPTIKMSLVITGHSLSHILQNDILSTDWKKVQETFLELAEKCATVVACRVSQIQKAQVVMLVRSYNRKAMTLAIGDGANDVGMIMKAHVGIGISGKEGMQAVMASDYAFAQFRFLKNLLLAHGRWNYKRMAKLVVYSFYKNFSFTLCQFWFAMFSGFGGQTIFPGEVIAVFNVLFTGLPIMVLAVLDQDCSRVSVERFPKLYREGQESADFNNKRFLYYLFNGVYQSLVFFFVPYLAFKGWTTVHNQDFGLWAFGMLIGTCAIIAVNLKLAIETRYWTWLNHLATWGSILLWFLFITVLAAMGGDMSWVMFQVYQTPQYYLVVIITVVIALAPDLIQKYFRAMYEPRSADIVKELESMNKQVPTDEELEMDLKTKPFRPMGLGTVFRGFSFAAEHTGKQESAVSFGLGLALQGLRQGFAPIAPTNKNAPLGAAVEKKSEKPEQDSSLVASEWAAVDQRAVRGQTDGFD